MACRTDPIGAISDKRVELLSIKVIDNPKLNVYRDSVSNVIWNSPDLVDM